MLYRNNDINIYKYICDIITITARTVFPTQRSLFGVVQVHEYIYQLYYIISVVLNIIHHRKRAGRSESRKRVL